MNKQTEDYIILKPISERFNIIAKDITDQEIKDIIKESLKNRINEQIKNIDISDVQEIIDDYISDNASDILDMVSKSLNKKLNL